MIRHHLGPRAVAARAPACRRRRDLPTPTPTRPRTRAAAAAADVDRAGRATSNDGDDGNDDDDDATPLLLAVAERASRAHELPLHVPGHQRGRALHPRMRRLLESPDTAAHDLTELSGLDCLAAASMLLAAEADRDADDEKEGGGVSRHESNSNDSDAPPLPLLAAQRLASRAFRSRATFFLVNGTSGGLHAAVSACCADGDALVAPRSCHQSAFAACAVSGASPLWLAPERQRVGSRRRRRGRGKGGKDKDEDDDDDDDESIAHGVTAGQVARALDAVLRGPEEEEEEEGEDDGGGARGGGGAARRRAARTTPTRVGAVLITSPTYFGAVAPVREIARECHRRGVPLIVDEAHGAHLAPMRLAVERAAAAAAKAAAEGSGALSSPLSSSSLLDGVPEPALWQGADISVQSAHKTLTALTQAALLHVGDGQSDNGDDDGIDDDGRQRQQKEDGAAAAAAKSSARLGRKPLVPAWRVARCLQALQSSSPSYLLTCSLDAARALAFGPGAERDWARALEGAAALRWGLRARVPGARLLEDAYRDDDGRRRHHDMMAASSAGDGNRGGNGNDSSSSNNSGSDSRSDGGKSSSKREGESSSVAGWDPLRVAVDVSGLGLGPLATGDGAAAWLERERGVVAELSVGPLVVMVWGGGGCAGGGGGGGGREEASWGGGGNGSGNSNGSNDNNNNNNSSGGGCSVEDAERVVAAFEALAACAGREAAAPEPVEDEDEDESDEDNDAEGEGDNAPPPPLAPRAALFGAARLPPPLRVPLSLAARRRLVSAELLCPYPPGIPEVLPGERLTPGAARRLRAALRRGGTVSGASDAALATVLVFADGE